MGEFGAFLKGVPEQMAGFCPISVCFTPATRPQWRGWILEILAKTRRIAHGCSPELSWAVMNWGDIIRLC